MISPTSPVGSPASPIIARIERREAEAPYVRAVRVEASGRSTFREDMRFFLFVYVAALIVLLSWLA